jgi:hypothetical protein
VRVIDFGIAAAVDPADLTSSGVLMGTPGWLTPEHVRGETLTPAGDVFAWGSPAVYTTTGRPPFGAGELPAAAYMYRLAHDDPDLSGVPINLRGLVASALNRDPTQRPPAKELLDGLLPIAPAHAVEAVDERRTAVMGALAATEIVASPPSAAAASPHRQWRAAVAGFAAIGGRCLAPPAVEGGGRRVRRPRRRRRDRSYRDPERTRPHR